jgi:pimeloyl-ACP methyl ester carboxylesterase
MSKTTLPTQRTVSADGTPIAYEVRGSGPALVLVDGALCRREMGPSRGFAEVLADRFTVYAYDRRGRGESGAGTSPWALEREVEDLAAVIEAAGGHAHLLGTSSGAALALEAARRGVQADKVVGYEAPFILDDSHAPNDPALPARLKAYVEAGKRGDAVAVFMKTVGVPGFMTRVMALTPVWKKLTAVAHTLPYDLEIIIGFEQGAPLPEGYYAGLKQQVLMIGGGKSPVYMRNAQQRIAEAVPDGRYAELPGQTHMVKAAALGPVAAKFLGE